MSNIIFYTNPQSRGAVVRWLLTELDVEYQTVIVDYESTQNPHGIKSPDYLAINPMGKVPAIKDGDVVITETAAICAYLTDTFADSNSTPTFAPKVDSPLRGEYYRWLFFTHGVLEPAVFANAMETQATISAEQKKALGYGCLDDVLQTLETTLTHRKYLVSDSFTTADLYLAHTLNFYLAFKLIPESSVLQEYSHRHTSREGFAKAQKLDEALM